MVDKCAESMESDGTIGKSPSAWGSPVCTVAKADGSPRFCVDYRNTINKSLVQEVWPLPDIDFYIDTVGGAEYITVCDVQDIHRQIRIAKKDCHKTPFVTSKCKYLLKVLPFGIADGYFNVQCLL